MDCESTPYDPSVVVAVDFDGTLTTHDALTGGDANLDEVAVDACKEMQSLGAFLCLWTSREGVQLRKAIEMCSMAGLSFDAINEGNGLRGKSRKINADFYIDDRAELDEIDWLAWLDKVRMEVEYRCTKSASEWR